MLTAAARALHREEPRPWILDDHLALRLAGDEAISLIGTLRNELPERALHAFSRWACVRARVPEDMVERAAADGIRQYVILGAGLDSFAYRRGDLLDRITVFEVDHAASQEWKRERLAALQIGIPANLVYVPVDFEHQTLRETLESAGLDLDAPAIFSWLGVTMYLTLEAIRTTLAFVAGRPAGTRIALTYNLPQSALSDLGLAIEPTLRKITAEMGEPMISLFTPAEIDQLAREIGFDDVEHIGPDEARQLYFPGRSDVKFGGAQRLIVATVV